MQVCLPTNSGPLLKYKNIYEIIVKFKDNKLCSTIDEQK